VTPYEALYRPTPVSVPSSFLHRVGSGLNPHPHFHLAVTDGPRTTDAP